MLHRSLFIPLLLPMFFVLWSPSANAQCGICLEVCIGGCSFCVSDGPCRSSGPIPAGLRANAASVAESQLEFVLPPNKSEAPLNGGAKSASNAVLPDRRRRKGDRMLF